MKTRQITAKFLWFWGKHRFGFVDIDKQYGAQCVDLIRAYCKEVFGYVMGTLPRARLLSSQQLKSDERRELNVGVDVLRMGDVVSVDLIPKNENGHIFIIYKQTKDGYYYVDQNGIGGAYRNGKVNNIKGNGVEKRFAKWNTFKILRAFRHI